MLQMLILVLGSFVYKILRYPNAIKQSFNIFLDLYEFI